MGIRDQLSQKLHQFTDQSRQQQQQQQPQQQLPPASSPQGESQQQSQSQSQQQSSSMPPPVTLGGPPSGRGKRGLCWEIKNERDQVALFTRPPGEKISWIYNWSPHPTPTSTSPLLDFVPMSWNHTALARLPQDLDESPHARHLLAFNEPELPDQSNIPVDVAVAAWMDHLEPLRKKRPGGLRCGSPAISNAPHAVGWLQQFLAGIRARGGDVDFLCLHWYGPDLGGFYDYIWSTHHQLDPALPVWITEFACTNWSATDPLPRDHVQNFARESVKYLDTLDWVERYAWFGPFRDCGTVGVHACMFDDQGGLTELGKRYRDE